MMSKFFSGHTVNSLIEGQYLSYYMAIACMILVPVNVNYLPPFMILWGIFWIIENRTKLGTIFFEKSPGRTLMILFFIFYLWQIVGMIYASHTSFGMERIIKRLSYLLFPLVLFHPGKMILNNIEKLLKVFVFGCVIFMTFSFGIAATRSLSFASGNLVFNPHPEPNVWENFFYSTNLTNYIHPSYISVYVLVALIISIDFAFTCAGPLFSRLYWVLIAVFLSISIYFLASRAGIIAGVILVPYNLFSRIRIKRVKIFVLLALPLFMIFVYQSLKTNYRFYYTIEKIKGNNIEDDDANSKDLRWDIWKSAAGVIRQNFFIGVGTGDASEELKSEYLKDGYKDGYYQYLNSHNQFLEVLLENGIIGLLIFLLIFVFIAVNSIRNYNLVYGSFMFIIIVFFTFESMLNRLAGVTFFPLFSFMLGYLKDPLKRKV